MKDENVVMFPSSPGEPSTLEGVRERVDSIREVFIEASLETLVDSVMEALNAAGFEWDEDSVEDALFLQEALRSMMHSAKGIYHPLQETARSMFDVDHESGTAVFHPQQNGTTDE